VHGCILRGRVRVGVRVRGSDVSGPEGGGDGPLTRIMRLRKNSALSRPSLATVNMCCRSNRNNSECAYITIVSHARCGPHTPYAPGKHTKIHQHAHTRTDAPPGPAAASAWARAQSGRRRPLPYQTDTVRQSTMGVAAAVTPLTFDGAVAETQRGPFLARVHKRTRINGVVVQRGYRLRLALQHRQIVQQELSVCAMGQTAAVGHACGQGRGVHAGPRGGSGYGWRGPAARAAAQLLGHGAVHERAVHMKKGDSSTH
jgi:hypothetical protein